MESCLFKENMEYEIILSNLRLHGMGGRKTDHNREDRGIKHAVPRQPSQGSRCLLREKGKHIKHL
jgi:hypothetical protein